MYCALRRQVRLEESTWLCVELMIPCGGFSAEVVRGVPPGLAEFAAPLQRAALCRLALQPHARGDWAVYLCRAPPARPDPRPLLVQLHKNSNGMGLSIVAAKVPTATLCPLNDASPTLHPRTSCTPNLHS